MPNSGESVRADYAAGSKAVLNSSTRARYAAKSQRWFAFLGGGGSAAKRELASGTMKPMPSFRPMWKAAIASMVVVALHVVTLPFVYVMLLIPFMEHGSHGVGVEPRWVGHLAVYADAVVLSALAGSILGNS